MIALPVENLTPHWAPMGWGQRESEMSMSKKDYQAIAGAIYDARQLVTHMPGDHADVAFRYVMSGVASVMAADNPRFDRARFVEACETGACKGMKQAGKGRDFYDTNLPPGGKQ